MKRGGLLRICTAVAALSLASAGLAPRVQAARPHANQVTVTIWTAYTGGLLKAFTTLSDRFQTLYPSIKIDEVSSNSYGTLLPKEQSAVFAGNTPTLGQSYESWTSQFAKSGAVQNLAPYINGKQGLTKSEIKDFFPKVWSDGLIGKTRYMMPFSKSDIVLYFNRALLRRAHISQPPATWYQFASDCAKVTKRQGSSMSQWCTTFELGEPEWYAWERGWGSPILSHNRAAFATKKGAAPVAFFANLVKRKEMVVSTSNNYQGQADFDAGKTAFYMGTSAGLTYVVSGAKPGVETAVAPFPAGPVRRATEMFGAPLIMFSKASASEKQAGWLFMKWLTDPGQTAYWAMNTGYMPVRQSALKMSEMKKFYRQNPQQRSSVRELKYAFVEPTMPGWTKASNDIATDLAPALDGQVSPLQAMRNAASQVNSDLSQG